MWLLVFCAFWCVSCLVDAKCVWRAFAPSPQRILGAHLFRGVGFVIYRPIHLGFTCRRFSTSYLKGFFFLLLIFRVGQTCWKMVWDRVRVRNGMGEKDVVETISLKRGFHIPSSRHFYFYIVCAPSLHPDHGRVSIHYTWVFQIINNTTFLLGINKRKKGRGRETKQRP